MPAPAIATLTPSAVLMCKNDPALLTAGRQGLLGFDEYGLWVFQGKPEDDMKPSRDPQGTGTCAIVISNDDTWSGGSQFNTAEFPLLQVLIYCDATRDVSGQVKQDQRTKAWKLYEILNDLFHDDSNTKHDWFGTKVHSSIRNYGPRVEAVPDTDGLVRLMVRYEVKL